MSWGGLQLGDGLHFGTGRRVTPPGAALAVVPGAPSLGAGSWPRVGRHLHRPARVPLLRGDLMPPAEWKSLGEQERAAAPRPMTKFDYLDLSRKALLQAGEQRQARGGSLRLLWLASYRRLRSTWPR